MISLNINTSIGSIVVRMKCIEIGWRVCWGVLTEKVPCSEDASSCNRKLDKANRRIHVKRDFDIPISSSLDSGMVPFLMYEVRLLPK